MINVLLTGSNGFVGSYFKSKYSDKHNLKAFSFLNDNLKELNLSNIDTIIHLSALVHKMNETREEEYEKINVTQTSHLAKKAKESGVKHFIFMSTVAVYGIETGAMSEDTDCNPITDYGKSKYKAENELQEMQDNSFKVSIVRAPIVNGYNAPGNMKSLINLVKKISVLPFRDIKNRRSMVYVGNLCHLIDTICEKKRSGIFLASDDRAISTTRLIELIARELGKKVYLVKIPFFRELLKLFKPSFYKKLYESLEVDNTETKKVLEFENLYSVEDGIRLMIKGDSK